MGAVATLDEVYQAVESYSVDSLALSVAPDADGALRESLESSGLLLLGECHGVAENPLVVTALLEHLNLRGLALEWEADMRPALAAYLSDGEIGALADHPLFWCGDGGLTAGHLAMLRELARDEAFALALFSGPSPPGWSARDAAMADRFLPQLRTSTLIVAGRLHADVEPNAHGIPLGAHLAKERPGLRSVQIRSRRDAARGRALVADDGRDPGGRGRDARVAEGLERRGGDRERARQWRAYAV